ncbi:hypothetical protein KBD68_01635 [Candidatus Woesebacteria bacterium]|jgi:hypothetical protein|nr:hypothetical protein [Candidatus Woesebacteria bacterium]
MKKIFISVLMLVAASSATGVAYAADTTCVSQYGGGVVCGTRTPQEPHIPVNAALGDVSTTVLGVAALVLSGVVFVYSRKNTSSAPLI